MKTTVVRPDELGDAELARWRAFQAADSRLSNPFLAPEFTLAVGRARPGARVAVLQDAGQVVGYFPYEVRGRVIGKPIGAGISDCQGVIHAPGGDDFDPVALLRACQLPIWEFDHLIAGQRAFRPHHTEREGSPVMDLSGGYQAYLAARLAATRGSVRAALRKQRRLARERGGVRFDYDVRDPELLDTLISWKSAQYRRTGMVDRFASDWITQVVRDLYASRADGCAGTLCALYAGGELLAVDLGLRSGSMLVDWFPAYRRSAARHSPGMLLALAMAEAAAMSGIRHIDLGKGQAEFKDTLKSDELPVATGRVVRCRPVAYARRVQLTLTGRLRGRAADLIRIYSRTDR